MRKKLKGFKYQIKPTKEQEEVFHNYIKAGSNMFNMLRRIQSDLINERQKTYNKETKEVDNSIKALLKFDLMKKSVEIKNNVDYGFSKIPSRVIESAAVDFDAACQSFWRNVKAKKPVREPKEGKTLTFQQRYGFPRFKNSKNLKKTFRIRDMKVDLENWTIRVPLLGLVNIRKQEHFKFEGKAKQATFYQRLDGKWFVSIIVEMEVEEVKQKEIKKETAIGIDCGISKYFVCSNGEEIENPRFFVKIQKELRIAQRKLDRKYQKGKPIEEQSNGYHKQKLVVAKIHEKVKNQRKTFQHQLSAKIVRENDTICMENLNIQGMVRNKRLAKHISDASWGQQKQFIKYKAAWHGKNYVEVDRFYPSSKLCNKCGHKLKKEELPLRVRTWLCPSCESQNKRDKNASDNIEDEGIRILTTPKETKKVKPKPTKKAKVAKVKETAITLF